MQKHIPSPGDDPVTDRTEHIALEQGSFALQDFINVVRARRAVILGTTIIVVALATLTVFLLRPLYTSTAIVMLDQRRNNVEDRSAVLSDLPSNASTVQNQVQILTSLELMNRVIDKLRLDKDPEFTPRAAAGPLRLLTMLNPFTWFSRRNEMRTASRGFDLERSRIVHALLDRLTVRPIGLSTAMEVSFKSEDPDKAATLANAISDAYVQDQLEAKFEATQKATKWLAGRIADLSRQAQDADAAVQRYKAEHNITTTNAGVSVLQQRTTDINSQLTLAKADLAEKQASYSSIAALAKTGQAASSGLVVASALISTLRTQEADLDRQLADISTKYLPGHPKIIHLKAQIANIDAKIGGEVQRVVDAARNEVSVASAHVASLEASLKHVETQGAGQNQDQVQLTALESAATSNRSMYEAFLGRLTQTQDQEGIQTPDERVISQAEPPTSPSFPMKGLTIGIALPAGLFLGLVLAFALERLDPGFRTTGRVEDLLGIPVLATVPEIKGLTGGAYAADSVVDKPKSAFAEAIRGLQLGLRLSSVDTPPKVIIVTSSVPAEGKTTLALSLARTAACSGLRTIVVDCDLRRPGVTKFFGDFTPAAGLLEALRGTLPPDKCFTKDPKSEVLILPCLKTPARPTDLLNSQSLKNLITMLRQTFDLVVIDSTPMLPVNDTRLIAQLADTVLFVVRWESTPREAVSNGLRALSDARANVSGIALARADEDRFRNYNYGHQNYSEYDNYYRN